MSGAPGSIFPTWGEEEEMGEKKIAVLSTSLCQPPWYGWTAEKMYSFGLGPNEKGEKNPSPSKVTEIHPWLRTLLDQGCQVLVITTRFTVGGPLDAGWLPLIPSDNLFVPTEVESCGEDHRTGGRCLCYIENYRRLYGRLGIPFPGLPEGQGWNWYHRQLQEHGVVIDLA